MSTGTNQPFAF